MKSFNSVFRGNSTSWDVHVGDVVEFSYPCSNPHSCDPISLLVPPGKYKMEVYGASGGTEKEATTQRLDTDGNCLSQSIVSEYRGNTKCFPLNAAGAGGYISGIISLTRSTQLFLRIGGKGTYFKALLSDCNSINSEKESVRPKGGFNGGGNGLGYFSGSSGGGGSTDIRISSDDLWHRVIVGGGGGGIDDSYFSGKIDDGSGGAGGYPKAQSFFLNSVLDQTYNANQTNGFSFGQGQSATFSNVTKTDIPIPNSKMPSDRASAGGGWFGGICSNSHQGGAGGGSSFILSKNAIFPSQPITQYDSLYNPLETKSYAFNEKSEYFFRDVSFANGIWNGNGLIRITIIAFPNILSCSCIQSYQMLFQFIIISVK